MQMSKHVRFVVQSMPTHILIRNVKAPAENLIKNVKFRVLLQREHPKQ